MTAKIFCQLPQFCGAKCKRDKKCGSCQKVATRGKRCAIMEYRHNSTICAGFLPVGFMEGSAPSQTVRKVIADMTKTFYEAFEGVNYPCYWLGRDGTYWANNAAWELNVPSRSPEYYKKQLEALLEDTAWPPEDKEATGEPLLQTALRLGGAEVLPHPDGLFVANHTHEEAPVDAFSRGLREPVSDMLSAVQALTRRLENCNLREGDEAFCHECLESIQKNEYYLLRLAYNMEIYNITQARPSSRKTLEMGSFIGQLCNKAKNTFARQGIPFGVELGGDILPVKADERVLGHAVANLLRNTIHFTSEGNHVEVSLRKVGRWAALTVQDKGMGIRPEALPHVFVPYYSAHPYMEGEERPGLGLGLALVQNAVQASGGTVALESNFGEGTSVTLALPLVEGEDLPLGSGSFDYDEYFSNSQSPVYIQLCGYCPLPVM